MVIHDGVGDARRIARHVGPPSFLIHQMRSHGQDLIKVCVCDGKSSEIQSRTQQANGYPTLSRVTTAIHSWGSRVPWLFDVGGVRRGRVMRVIVVMLLLLLLLVGVMLMVLMVSWYDWFVHGGCVRLCGESMVQVIDEDIERDGVDGGGGGGGGR